MIEVENLVRRFGERIAVDNLTFRVNPGEVLGFLGPNGAGKSTTMRMITGYLAPTRGTVKIQGVDVISQASRAKSLVGYLPESAPGYGELTVTEFLKFSARIRGLARQAASIATAKTIELCFLESVAHQTIGTLSKGYRHRTCLAQSIVHDPPVLILDEPTDGLDPNQKHEIRMLIREMGRKKAIVFSTHILEEVEAVCDRVLMINHGRQISAGTPAELKSHAPGAGDLILVLSGPSIDEVRAAVDGFDETVLVDISPAVSAAAGLHTGVAPRSVTQLRLRSRHEGADTFALKIKTSQCAARLGWNLIELRTDEGKLDAFFQAVTGYTGRELGS